MDKIMSLEGECQKPSQVVNALLKVMSLSFIGHEEVLQVALGAYFIGGHVLIEDMPGLGKTTLAKTLAKYVGGVFARVQFTPDLMPTDILGVSIFNQVNRVFEYKEGPIFTNIFMADEINRSSPKTQSSLLEAMEEGQVSAEGKTLELPQPFMVIATQNPIEFEGTFPLPEAQLDRFLVSIRLGYGKPQEEMNIYRKELLTLEQGEIHEPVMFSYELIAKTISEVYLSEAMYKYVYEIISCTRQHESLYYGLSPRAGIGMLKLAKYWAFLDNRDYVIPEDIKKSAPYVMRHRLVLKPDSKYRGESVKAIIENILSGVSVPKGAI